MKQPQSLPAGVEATNLSTELPAGPDGRENALAREIRPRGASDQLHRANLSNLLSIVHRSRDVSRAELTRRTGLNRSTIGDLVAELTELGLVYEAMPTGQGVPGRPSPLVHVDPGVVSIVVNPEVDAVTIGLVSLGGKLLSKIRVELTGGSSAAHVVSLSAAAIAGLLAAREHPLSVVGIGIAVPGQVRLFDSEVRDATHLGWVDEPLGRMMATATGLPTWAANGANLGMRAESVFGVGRNIDDLVYFIGGPSGIGGGAVTGGTPLVGSAGYAGELGHLFVRSNGRACACGARGCLEAEVTQAALLASVGLANSQADLLAERLVESTDPFVRALIAEQLELVGIAVRNAVNAFNPQLVVLGGFLGGLYRAGGSNAESLCGEAIKAARSGIRVEQAALGLEEVLIGAGELAFAELFDDPAAFDFPQLRRFDTEPALDA